MTAALALTPAETALGLALPHRRMEEWRWTDLRQLVRHAYPPGQPVKTNRRALAALAGQSPFASEVRARAVFVNGRYDGMLSRTLTSRSAMFQPGLPPVPMDADPLTAINARLAEDGVSLVFSGSVDKPMELLFLSTAGPQRSIGTRCRIVVEPGASATVVETHLGEGDYLASSLVQIELGAGARLDRIKAEIESPDAVHLGQCLVTMGEGAVLRDFTLTSGARLNRQNGNLRFSGAHGNALIAGSYLLSGRQHADTRLIVDHAVPACTSRELFKCVLGGEARGIFQGKVHVARDAQKTDGKQSSHALLLSETAEFDAKPELEIYADDVACGHGATAGDLDPDHLFYLRSRGVSPDQARALLVQAFVTEALDTVDHEGIRAVLAGLVERRLAGGG